MWPVTVGPKLMLKNFSYCCCRSYVTFCSAALLSLVGPLKTSFRHHKQKVDENRFRHLWSLDVSTTSPIFTLIIVPDSLICSCETVAWQRPQGKHRLFQNPREGPSVDEMISWYPLAARLKQVEVVRTCQDDNETARWTGYGEFRVSIHTPKLQEHKQIRALA
jgi:hypothetical protein